MAAERVFRLPVRVYWEDTDAGGVVYYANYLKFLERARSEWLRSIGIDQAALAREERIQFAIVEASLRYRLPARYDDLLEVSVRVDDWKRASMTLLQEVRRAADGGLLTEATVRAACLDSDTLRPRAFPAALLKELAGG